eukprot:CAMPEP_0175511852 /NCGR_PEP_ID=MMETSP0096-20121207/12109_1 /TAXON_ID=311494 /ORGANISM="Alexandrium monilatum, Strain CCMP3105" /LENGTH=39 /DNA_ID= /DNA_START= /DNA_END= /DNA_ORIENTATION=
MEAGQPLACIHAFTHTCRPAYPYRGLHRVGPLRLNEAPS